MESPRTMDLCCQADVLHVLSVIWLHLFDEEFLSEKQR
jgi:hypothetical protein